MLNLARKNTVKKTIECVIGSSRFRNDNTDIMESTADNMKNLRQCANFYMFMSKSKKP